MIYKSCSGRRHTLKLMEEITERIDGSDKAPYNHSASTEMDIVKVDIKIFTN